MERGIKTCWSSSLVGETAHHTKYDKVVRDALGFVEINYLDNLSLSAAAKYVAMFHNCFSKIFVVILLGITQKIEMCFILTESMIVNSYHK